MHALEIASVPSMVPLLLPLKKIANSAKERVRNLALEYSLPPHTDTQIVRMGAAADEISAAARKTDADLIAIATRGYTGLKHAFLGSTTERVMRGAPCPVLVVREKEQEPVGNTGRSRTERTSFSVRKILVPLDFSEPSRTGLDYAVRFAREFRASLVLFHSVFVHAYVLSDEYTALGVPSLIASMERFARDDMQKLQKGLVASKLEIETEIASGSPAERVCEYVQKTDVDLIITSTHGRSGLRRVFIGSTAEHIVRHATCPVLVVPNRPTSQEKRRRESK